MARYIAGCHSAKKRKGSKNKKTWIYFTTKYSPHPRALYSMAKDILKKMQKDGKMSKDAEVIADEIYKIPSYSSRKLVSNDEEIEYCPQVY